VFIWSDFFYIIAKKKYQTNKQTNKQPIKTI